MSPIQSTLIVLSVAAAAGAQTAPLSSDLGRPGRFEIALTPSFGKVYKAEQSGFGLDAQFHLPSVFFLKAGAKSYTDIDTYTFGLGVAIPAGNGRVTLGLDGNAIDIKSHYWYYGSGIEYQTALRVAYDYQFASGLRLGVGFTEFLNSNYINNVAAPTFTVGYKFAPKGPTLSMTYSNHDAILGLLGKCSSINTSLTLAF